VVGPERPDGIEALLVGHHQHDVRAVGHGGPFGLRRSGNLREFTTESGRLKGKAEGGGRRVDVSRAGADFAPGAGGARTARFAARCRARSQLHPIAPPQEPCSGTPTRQEETPTT
jgi:hypothetical protein